jgi:hypothetical protein
VLEITSLIGREVTQVWVWWSLRLVFDPAPGQQEAAVDVTWFRFTDPDGVIHDLDIGAEPMSAGRVLAIPHHKVTEASIEDWELRLAFDNGAAIACPPHPKFEAWAIAAERAPGFCPPGGGKL